MEPMQEIASIKEAYDILVRAWRDALPGLPQDMIIHAQIHLQHRITEICAPLIGKVSA